MEYNTHDLPLAAYIMCKGHKLTKTERDDRNRVTFFFDDTGNMDQAVNGYFSGDLVSAIAFQSKMRELKNLIFNVL